jgi:hypothetical protein
LFVLVVIHNSLKAISTALAHKLIDLRYSFCSSCVISAKNNICSLAMIPLAGTKEVPNAA